MIPLFDNNFDVRVVACQRLKLGQQVGAGGCGRGPAVTALEYELADVRDEGGMAICWEGAQLTSENGGRH